jgi:hypothetical protein
MSNQRYSICPCQSEDSSCQLVLRKPGGLSPPRADSNQLTE